MTVLIDGPAEATGNDVLLMGASADPTNQALMRWKDETPDLHEFMPDHHRLVLEHWIWEHRDELAGKTILDIGAQNPRRWLGDGYRTFGHTADVEADIKGDLLDLVRPDNPTILVRIQKMAAMWANAKELLNTGDYVAYQAALMEAIDRLDEGEALVRDMGEYHQATTSDVWDAIICTEVLEHCEDPIEAVREMHSALKPGGLLLVTSPFLWPWHGTQDYADYWRFTRQGWQLLLKDFHDVTIKAVPWTAESVALLDLVRRFEGWGFRHFIEGHTGYLCEAHKGG